MNQDKLGICIENTGWSRLSTFLFLWLWRNNPFGCGSSKSLIWSRTWKKIIFQEMKLKITFQNSFDLISLIGSEIDRSKMLPLKLEKKPYNTFFSLWWKIVSSLEDLSGVFTFPPCLLTNVFDLTNIQHSKWCPDFFHLTWVNKNKS